MKYSVIAIAFAAAVSAQGATSSTAATATITAPPSILVGGDCASLGPGFYEACLCSRSAISCSSTSTSSQPASNMTISTATTTQVITISSCAPTVTNCPYTTAPIVKTSTIIYTTACAVTANAGNATRIVVPAVSTITNPGCLGGCVNVATKSIGTIVVPTTTAKGAVYTGAADSKTVAAWGVVAGLAAAVAW